MFVGIRRGPMYFTSSIVAFQSLESKLLNFCSVHVSRSTISVTNETDIKRRLSSRSWNERLGDETTCKNESKRKNNIFLLDALFSKKWKLKVQVVRIRVLACLVKASLFYFELQA